MTAERSVDWIKAVHHSTGMFVHHERCLSHLCQQLASPRTTFPSLILFLGQKRKDVALRELFPDNQVPPERPYIQVQVDNRTLFGDHPILFVQYDPHRPTQKLEPRGYDCEEIPIPWASPEDNQVLDIFLARLLFLFVDVICIFADDIGGLDAVYATLTTWATLGRNASSLDYKPRVVIVKDSTDTRITHTLLAETDFLFKLMLIEDVREVFGMPGLLHLPPGDLSDEARHKPLKDGLLKAVDISRRHRKEDGYLFSALHLEQIFHQVLHHICRTPQQPFEFVQTVNGTTPKTHSLHLQTFLGLTSSWDWEDQATFIASTLMVDAYPSGAHSFSAAAVFDTLYRRSCEDALDNVGMPSANCQLVEYQLAQFQSRLIFGQGPSRRIHQANLAQWQGLLRHVVTSRTCLGCLLRPPQHSLYCGHAYCDTCAIRYGSPVEGAESQYLVNHCILCQGTCGNLVNVLPRTAPVRAITIDGGGVRGFIPLRFLQLFQDFLGPGCPVQDLIDVAFGTSSGGLIVLKIFRQGRSVGECVGALTDLMVQFLRRHPPPHSVWAKIFRALHCWWTDSWYNEDTWNELLQTQFVSTECMFDVQPVSGTKVAVTALAKRALLLVNYRRVVESQGDGGYYDVHEPRDGTEEPKLWECARATTAAPFLLPPVELAGIGNCEDGGLKHNNPSLLCGSETPFIYPSRSVPGTLINLGTGSPTSPPPRRRGFAFRLFNWVMSSMDGEEAWDSFLHGVDRSKRQNYHRLSVTFPGAAPLLNSATLVRWMTGLVDQVARIQVPPALTSLLLGSLFLELSSAPRWEDGYYYCTGAIRCRLKGKVLVDALRSLHPKASTYVLGGEKLDVSPYDHAVCDHCSRYCAPVRFAVKETESQLFLSLQLSENRLQPLGGFPLSLRWFLEQQGLDLASPATDLQGLVLRTRCQSCDRRMHKNALVQRNRGYRKRVRFI